MLQKQTLEHLTNPTRNKHNANCVVMVPPKEFGFNPETAKDNEFQQGSALNSEELRAQAMAEFENMVAQLRSAGIQVVVLDYQVGEQPTPDAVFPNNWFSTNYRGELYTFPMACENRRREVRLAELREALEMAGRHIESVHSLEHNLEQQAFLESTGVMIFDHINKTVYAALSQRCDRDVLEQFAAMAGYSRVVSFQTALPSGKPIYHTNVMLAIGERFCVICDEVIPQYERTFVLKSLAKDKQIISITLEQMNAMCGNVLQLESINGEKVIAMSQTAYNAFTQAQRNQLASHGRILPFDVNTIETVGGGSVRCMLGEVFLPARSKFL
ncbi:arginine deiminase-related protein [Vibrio panuliri]|uniref:Amidinotransferase n=1 Tax=Vibrio panuliri TaxID=1381081 RepID=A0A1Q9HQY6_9VIBR|nr:arginine deiminase-related protein [Vibrio panuliri]KAB1458179.1 amidinotransferase [Vibrio panuliri]OLQ89437.1 amidinotransferase [Vibrio panuliri]OLQ93294.1 amidinotransferase [Vibrio panuliri]